MISAKRWLAGTALGVALGLVGVPAASAAEEPAFTRAQAEAELRDVTQAFSSPKRGIDPTLELRDLALAAPALEGAERRRARSILSRPPSGGEPPFGGNWPNNAEEMTVEAGEFVVHWAEIEGCSVTPPGRPDRNCDEPSLEDVEPKNGIPDYVDAVVEAVDDSIAVENGELGWPLPKSDADQNDNGGDGKLDVYLSDLCDESDFDPCVFGYANPADDSATCNGAPFKCAAYLVLDNDYAEFGMSGGLLGMRVTTAHEYNHILQFNLDTAQDTWMFESTAVWAEEQVFPADDDWVRSYMKGWARGSTEPITDPFAGGGLRIYGSTVWNHWLERGDGEYGADIILDAWELSRDVQPKDYAVGAYDAAIEQNGGEGFADEFASFAAATSEWRTGDGNFPDGPELTDVEREGKLAVGSAPDTIKLDNTSYQLIDVNPKEADRLTLKVKADERVRWGIALVGRDGTKRGGTVERNDASFADGGKGRVTLTDAQSYKRITAVVVNADGRVSGPKETFAEFDYTKNNKGFKVKVR